MTARKRIAFNLFCFKLWEPGWWRAHDAAGGFSFAAGHRELCVRGEQAVLCSVARAGRAAASVARLWPSRRLSGHSGAGPARVPLTPAGRARGGWRRCEPASSFPGTVRASRAPELFTPPRPAVAIEFPCRGTLPAPADEFSAALAPGAPCVFGAGGGGGRPPVPGSPRSCVAAGRWAWLALKPFPPQRRWAPALSLLQGLLAGLRVFFICLAAVLKPAWAPWSWSTCPSSPRTGSGIVSYLYLVLVEWISLQTTSLFFTHHLRFSLLLYPGLSGVIVLKKKNHVSQFLRGNFFFIVLIETNFLSSVMLLLVTCIIFC